MTVEVQPQEAARWFEAGDATILGVLTRPTVPSNGVGVVILNGGHSGSSAGKNRVHTRLAAELAGRGFHSLRLEWHGIGDSTGEVDEYVMHEPFVEEFIAASALLRDEGMTRIAVYGECLGARTAVVAAPEIPDLAAAYLVTLVLRDGALNEQTPQRLAAELPASEYAKRVGKLRHLGDPKRRALYGKLIRAKLRQSYQRIRYRSEGLRLEPWVSRQVVDALEGLGRRNIPVHLVYGTSEWDPHTVDFQQIEADLPPMKHPSIDAEIVDEMIAGYRSLQIQERLVEMIGQWFDEVVARDPA